MSWTSFTFDVGHRITAREVRNDGRFGARSTLLPSVEARWQEMDPAPRRKSMWHLRRNDLQTFHSLPDAWSDAFDSKLSSYAAQHNTIWLNSCAAQSEARDTTWDRAVVELGIVLMLRSDVIKFKCEFNFQGPKDGVEALGKLGFTKSTISRGTKTNV